MKRFILCIAIFLIGVAQAYSKSIPIRATIVNISKDTSTVYFNDKKWKITPSEIPASSTPDGQPEIVLRPSNTNEIRIDSGDYYIRAILHVDMLYSSSTNASVVFSTDSSKIDTIFLRVLVKGPIDLYLFTDVNSKDHFFVKTPGSDYLELIDKNIPGHYLVDTYLDYSVHVSNYQDELKLLMGDCPDAISKINSLEYKERQFLKLFLAYTKCKKEIPDYVTPVKTATTKFAVVAGISMTKIEFNGYETPTADHPSSYLHLSSFPTSFDPVLGFKFILPISRTDDKVSFHSSILWWGYNTKSNYKDPSDNEYFIHFKTDYLKLVLGPSYKFNMGRIQPFVSTGFIGMVLLHILNDKHVEYGNVTVWQGSYATYYDDDAYFHPTSTDAGFFGTLGVSYNRFSFEARYNRSKGMSSSIGMKTPVTSVELIFSYNLVK